MKAIKEIKFELTELQHEYLDAFLWMLKDRSFRRQGRSHLMAVAFIISSLHNAGLIITYDHMLDRHNRKRMLDIIKGVIEFTEGLDIKDFKFHKSEYGFEYIGKEFTTNIKSIIK